MLFNDLELIDQQILEMSVMSQKQLLAFQAEQEINSILDDLESLREEIKEWARKIILH